MNAPEKCPKCHSDLIYIESKGMDIEARVFQCGTTECVHDNAATIESNACRLIDALRAEVAALDAALAEAVAVACKWRDHHAEKGSTERATYWNDLAVRWQDARAEANAGPAGKGGDE